MNTKDFKTINCSDIKVGMRFSAPVFFDDGVNMFLAEGKTAKMYHVAALKRWAVPFLLTYGRILDEKENMNAEEYDDIEELEELEELEEI